MHIQIKRIYDDASPDDGTRVLVDRLWPRGISKQRAAIDHWAKDLAPSTDLRKSFGHEMSRFDAFAHDYERELHANAPVVDAFLNQIDRRRRLTLLFAARSPQANHARVLKSVLENWVS